MSTCERLRGIVCPAHCKAEKEGTGCRDGWHGDLCIGPMAAGVLAVGTLAEAMRTAEGRR